MPLSLSTHYSHFKYESFQSITCTGTDNLTQNNQDKYATQKFTGKEEQTDSKYLK